MIKVDKVEITHYIQERIRRINTKKREECLNEKSKNAKNDQKKRKKEKKTEKTKNEKTEEWECLFFFPLQIGESQKLLHLCYLLIFQRLLFFFSFFIHFFYFLSFSLSVVRVYFFLAFLSCYFFSFFLSSFLVCLSFCSESTSPLDLNYSGLFFFEIANKLSGNF